MPEQPARRAVPPFDRIIHIGAPKCGSTTLQALWHANRAELERAGVHYVGNRTHWAAPAKAVAGVKQRISDVVPPLSNWEALTKEVSATTERLALISSEWYASATKEAVHRIVRDLERERLHAFAFDGFEGLLPGFGGIVQNEGDPGGTGGFAVQRRGGWTPGKALDTVLQQLFGLR